jgi:acyl-CoA thioesterase FadM
MPEPGLEMEADAGSAAGAPFTAYRERVRPEWLDYNGHLHDASYATVLSDAHELVFESLGLSADYRISHDASMFTVETHIRFLAECSEGQTLTAATTLVDADSKRMRLHSEAVRGRRPGGDRRVLLRARRHGSGRTAPRRRPAGGRRRDAATFTALPRPAHLGLGVGARRDRPRDHAVRGPRSGSVGPRGRDRRAPPPHTVLPEWLDYNGHMGESCYLLAFGDSADAFFRFISIGRAYRAAGHSLCTSGAHLHHRQEAAEGEPLEATVQVLDHDRHGCIFHGYGTVRPRAAGVGRAGAGARRHGGRSLDGHAGRPARADQGVQHAHARRRDPTS